ncbi:MAG TPA: peptide-methionine (R)-S-oxide reductase [Hellea balneolensis]|uniref:peptide-methionine (R)-S-oxide reductase n=1 Tax=Hellea balneolensis TaxID=287478 RepID=A0A7C3G607_9PROT|nr:peptide-methionine (R)-S-oxide reductase [Hellea balneolensis]
MLNRRQFGFSLCAGLAATACTQASTDAQPALKTEGDMATNIDWKNIKNSEWKTRLGPQEFAVMRKEATERPFSSPLNDEKRAGTFNCAACGLPLFKASAKYKSGTGWPSFWEPIPGAIETKRDFKLVIPRTEYHCARCGAHQGHLFNDGPQPSGLRYCNNGIALNFVES